LPRVLLALTGGQKLGIALVAAAFIAFALLSSFVLPRRDANFPGRRLSLFVVVAILFFAGMMTAMVTLAKEPEEEGPEAQHPTLTERGATETAPATTAGKPATKGDPAAGKQVFASAGCGGCHTLKAAGSSGNVGPNLDQLKPSDAAAVKQVTNGGGGMPAFKDQLSEKQIQDVAAFVSESTH
jgi:mono/diheme cytochrome c family protein